MHLMLFQLNTYFSPPNFYFKNEKESPTWVQILGPQLSTKINWGKKILKKLVVTIQMQK